MEQLVQSIELQVRRTHDSTEMLQRKLTEFTHKTTGNWNGLNKGHYLHPDHEDKTRRHLTCISVLSLSGLQEQIDPSALRELFEHRLVYPTPVWDYLCLYIVNYNKMALLEYIYGATLSSIFFTPLLSCLLWFIILFSVLIQYDVVKSSVTETVFRRDHIVPLVLRNIWLSTPERK